MYSGVVDQSIWPQPRNLY